LSLTLWCFVAAGCQEALDTGDGVEDNTLKAKAKAVIFVLDFT